MKVVFKIILVCALVIFSPAVFAEFASNVLTHEDAQIQITVPTSWTQEPEGDVMTITSPDKEMAVVFMILHPKDKDKVLEEMDASLEKSVGEITWENDGNAKAEEINGMKCDEWIGVAKSGVQVDCIALDTPSGKVLGIYWLDTPESEKKFAAEIETIVRGLKPIEGAAAPAAAPADETASGSADAGEETEEGADDAE